MIIKNKVGAESSMLSYIMGIVIIAVLIVVLIFAFTGTSKAGESWWENLIGGGDVNVEAVTKAGCEPACSGRLEFDYCKKPRNVRFDKNKNNPDNREWTCYELVSRGMLNSEMLRSGCEYITCQIGCTELTGAICGGDSKCSVQWMNQGSLEERQENEVGDGKTWASIEEVPLDRYSDGESGSVCVKAILN